MLLIWKIISLIAAFVADVTILIFILKLCPAKLSSPKVPAGCVGGEPAAHASGKPC